MKLSEQLASFRQCLVKQAPKIIIVLLVIALIGAYVKLAQSIRENQKLRAEVKTAYSEVEQLKSDIVQTRHDKEIAVQQEKDYCGLLTTENEERVAAFAKQAAKCIPLIKRFDIKYTSPKEKR